MFRYLRIFIFILLATPCSPGQSATPSAAPATVPDLLQQAAQAYRRGNLDAAVEKFQAALQQDQNSGDAYAGLARTYLKQEKVQEAFETASKGVAQVPGSLPAQTALGEVYFRQAKMPEAEKAFLVGVNAPHADARACLGLSKLYAAYSLHARARKMLERAHELDPADSEIQSRWMRTLTRDKQIEWLQKRLAAPSNDDIHLQTYLDVLLERAKEPHLTCRLVSKVTSTEAVLKPMLIDPTHLHGFGLTVEVNGHSSRLLLDTGASGLLINRKLAERAGVKPVISTRLGGIGDKGDVDGYVGYADSIRIGELEFQNCPVRVSEKRSVVDDDGLLGTDVFSHYLVTIDFLWQKLKLEELPVRPGEKPAPATLASQQQDEAADVTSPADDKEGAGDETMSADGKAAAASGPQDRYIAPEMQNYTKVFRFGHDLLIPTRVGANPPKLFLIDTGAMINAISPQAAREVTKVRNDADMHVKGISGSVKNVYSADKAVLQFSHFKQENEDLTAFDLSHVSSSAGTEISGLLGFTTLRLFTIKIDYRDGLVDFIYTGPKK